MGDPPLSGSSHATSTEVESCRTAETACGFPGSAGSAGSNAENNLGPPDCRNTIPCAAFESAEAELFVQLTQPSEAPNNPRPWASTSKPLKSSRFLLVEQVVPALQTGPTWI